MSTIQSSFKTILPTSWFERMRRSSERWMVQCTRCKSERSIWSLGGIRFGAAAIGKRIAARCTLCGETVAARVYLHDDTDPR